MSSQIVIVAPSATVGAAESRVVTASDPAGRTRPAELRRQRALERDHIALRQRYVDLKVNYWRAIDARDSASTPEKKADLSCA